MSDVPTVESKAATLRKWRITALLMLLTGVSIALAIPTYRQLKKFRAHMLIGQAESLAGEKRWREAFERANAAYQLAPRDARTLRTLARFYSAAGQEQALDFWAALFEHKKGADEDMRDCAEFALKIGKVDLAKFYAVELTRKGPREVKNLLLWADVYRVSGDMGKAWERVREAKAAGSVNPDDRLRLSAIFLGSPKNEEVFVAKADLRELAKRPGEEGLQALRLLARSGGNSSADMAEWSGALARHRDKNGDDAFLALQLAIRSAPSQRGLLLDAKTAEAVTPDQVLALARWLNQQREYERVIRLISPAGALGRQDFYLVRLDALAGLGRWSDLEKELEVETVPLENVHREVFLARALAEQGKKDAAQSHWNRAQLDAVSKPEALNYLAQYALRVGEVDQAIRAFRRMAENPTTERIAHVQLVRLLETKGDTRGLRDLMKELVRSYPSDSAPRNDLIYLNLLLNEDIVPGIAHARELVAADPSKLSYRVTLALGYLRSGDVKTAAAQFEGVRGDWETALPSARVLYAATLGATGRTAEAREQARRIPQDRLKPEEKALIQPWLNAKK